MNKILKDLIIFFINLLIRTYKRINKKEFDARLWSNLELKKVASFFQGNIINVSAGNDSDKHGGFYKDYFKNASNYSISNYKEESLSNINNEVILDLEKGIPEDLINKYDIVFSHTVLEHVFDIDKAIHNLCCLSKDIVITIVPFIQSYHHEEDFYFDYWRFSPLALIKKFQKHNFKTIYVNWNKDPIGNIYIFHICSSKPVGYEKLVEFGGKNLKGFAPGFDRYRLHTRLNKVSERAIIKSLNDFVN